MKIVRVRDIEDVQLVALIAKSDEHLSALYPPESNHAVPLESLISEPAAFFACYIDGDVAACGGVNVVEDDVQFGEIKRVFVDEKHRGKQLATTMMRHLEAYLLENNVHIARLEAGPKQPAALKLYHKLGYRERGPFGDYKVDPLSVFLEKVLGE